MTDVRHTAESLFAQYFWPLYPPDVRADYERFRDLDANPAKNPALPAALSEAAELLAQNAPALLGTALTFDDAGVAALAAALTRARRDAWIASDTAGEPGTLFNTVVHAAAFVGEVAVRAHGAAWELRRPLWESRVKRRHGGLIAPFAWLLKSLADDAVDEGTLAWRWGVHVVIADRDPSAWPVLTEAKRLPSLKTPTYDLLVKYLHQHLPTLRDVGEGFPSAAEFTAKRYTTLGFEPLHGGRVLALHGQVPAVDDGPSTVEVMWLGAHGYDHADVLPCDRDVPHFARALNGDTLEVSVGWKGRPITHRVSLRGHV